MVHRRSERNGSVLSPGIAAIDLFAGPGGLAEGFSAAGFDIRLSIEKDRYAHETLLFRAFARKLIRSGNRLYLNAFYSGDLSLNELITRFEPFWTEAKCEAWRAELGVTPRRSVSDRICEALKETEDWVLLGGPPCQAYSLVGRARMKSTKADFEDDHRHFLYREYLRIVASHAPSIFVMENVRGLLSSTVRGSGIFQEIKRDLRLPQRAVADLPGGSRKGDLEYRLVPLWERRESTLFPSEAEDKDFIVCSENQGVPQARHRLFIIGIRADLNPSIAWLEKISTAPTAWDVIRDLPQIQSRVSRGDSLTWREILREFRGSDGNRWLATHCYDVYVFIRDMIRSELSSAKPVLCNGSPRMKRDLRRKPAALAEWLQAEHMPVFLNHEARSHMASDLHRYLFASAFAEVRGLSPKLSDFPPPFLPAHKNIRNNGGSIFNDRFRVQCKNRPSTTITSHIHKDGHYFIHPDPSQCRSLTVREAARLQTFPDDYLFCGPRTEQYKQVGNAVPPYLAFQIGKTVMKTLLSVASNNARKAGPETTLKDFTSDKPKCSA